jgi:hypothetical protein
MDHDHSGRDQEFRILSTRPQFAIKMIGKGDLLLERWALMKKCDMFEKTFKVKFQVRS